MEYNYQAIVERFQAARKASGLTQAQVISEVQTKSVQLKPLDDPAPQKIGLGGNTLSGFENGTCGLSLEQFLSICSICGMSAGYVLGEHDAKSFELQELQNKTGLSEPALEELQKLNNDRPRGDLGIALINSILTAPQFGELIKCYRAYATSRAKESVQRKITKADYKAYISYCRAEKLNPISFENYEAQELQRAKNRKRAELRGAENTLLDAVIDFFESAPFDTEEVETWLAYKNEETKTEN